MLREHLADAVRKLRDATTVAVITGAGVSAESGIPTFRGPDGTWSRFNLEDLATPQGFQRNPKRVWEWYVYRKKEYGDAKPNPAHDTIAAMERHYPEFLLITQNIDTLHSKAGSANVLEIHGNINKARCTACDTVFDYSCLTLPEHLISCPACGALARPHILWFGEMYDAAHLRHMTEFLSTANVVLIVGTSGTVTMPAHLAKYAMQCGAYAIEINPNESELSQHVDCYIREKAGTALPELWKAVTGEEHVSFGAAIS